MKQVYTEYKTKASLEEYANLELCVEKYSDLLFRTAYFQCKNRCDSEDIVQETYLRYMKKRPNFKNEEHEKAWFIRTTINLSKDYLKSYWVSKTAELNSDIPCMMESDYELMDTISRLPQKYRLVIQLHYIEGYSLKEISEILKKKPGTIGTWIDRAKKEIKKWSDSHGFY